MPLANDDAFLRDAVESPLHFYSLLRQHRHSFWQLCFYLSSLFRSFGRVGRLLSFCSRVRTCANDDGCCFGSLFMASIFLPCKVISTASSIEASSSSHSSSSKGNIPDMTISNLAVIDNSRKYPRTTCRCIFPSSIVGCHNTSNLICSR